MTDRIHPIAEWTSLVAYIRTRGLTAAGRAEAAPTYVLLVCGVWHVTLSHLCQSSGNLDIKEVSHSYSPDTSGNLNSHSTLEESLLRVI